MGSEREGSTIADQILGLEMSSLDRVIIGWTLEEDGRRDEVVGGKGSEGGGGKLLSYCAKGGDGRLDVEVEVGTRLFEDGKRIGVWCRKGQGR